MAGGHAVAAVAALGGGSSGLAFSGLSRATGEPCRFGGRFHQRRRGVGDRRRGFAARKAPGRFRIGVALGQAMLPGLPVHLAEMDRVALLAALHTSGGGPASLGAAVLAASGGTVARGVGGARGENGDGDGGDDGAHNSPRNRSADRSSPARNGKGFAPGLGGVVRCPRAVSRAFVTGLSLHSATEDAMRTLALSIAAAVILAPTSALAWGNEGHEIVAAIARDQLTPTARAKVDALLAADSDTLTAPDMLARATWADAWRGAGHKETASWHFVDVELDHPDLRSACFDYPKPADPASAGPAQDCVVDKIAEFQAELANPATPQAERILAVVYLLHLVGDLHQPLHAADNHDRGGNCVQVSLGGSRTMNLHHFWDTTVLEPLGEDPQAVASKLEAQITPADRAAWTQGDTRTWAMESYGVARSVVYSFSPPPGCAAGQAPVALPDGYADKATVAAEVQLQKAGVRLAWVLNTALR
jgi:hypothetical protein